MKAHCVACGKELTGGLDTFGGVGSEMCWPCYSETNAEGQASYYGLGPHHHDLTVTGSIIGSTVMDEVKPDANGQIVVDGATFTPDPDAPGLGVWTPAPLVGWK